MLGAHSETQFSEVIVILSNAKIIMHLHYTAHLERVVSVIWGRQLYKIQVMQPTEIHVTVLIKMRYIAK